MNIRDTVNKLLIEKTDNTFIQFFRSLFVGGAATLVDMGTLALLVECFDCNKIAAAVIAFIVGLAVNFIMSSFWVFKESNVNNKAAEFTVFAAIGVIGLGLNTLIIHLFDAYVSQYAIFGSLIPQDKYYLVGKIAATVIVFIWNFFARKILLYRKKEK